MVSTPDIRHTTIIETQEVPVKATISRIFVPLAMVLFLSLGISSHSFAQSWYNSSWGYRKSHTINSATGSRNELSVMITVYYGSGTDAGGSVYCNSICRTDFGDIRFTAADGSTLLNYWIQSSTTGNSAVFWVKLTDDLSSANGKIYIYYGNAGATATSSGTNTFNYYDDGSSATGWTTAGTVGSSSVQGNPVPALRAQGSSGSYLYRNTGIGPNTFTFFNVRTDNNNLGNFFFQCSSAGLGQMYRLDGRGTTNYTGFAATTNWITWNAPAASQTSSANTWYQFGIAINSPGTSSTLYYNQGTGTNPVPGTVLGTYTSTNSGTYIGLVGDGGGSTLYTYWDNIITRKYVSPEPAHAAWGGQEIPISISGFSPGSGCQGVAGIVITGTNFTGATAVNFNGVSTSFVVNSSTQITATVPLSATTGTIGIITPAGTATSSSSFTVNPLPTASASKTDISCFNAANGQIIITASPQGESFTYEYSINNGSNGGSYQSSNTFTLLTPGQYKIRVKDINNQCESIQIP